MSPSAACGHGLRERVRWSRRSLLRRCSDEVDVAVEEALRPQRLRSVLPQPGIDLVEHRRARTEVLLSQRIEGRVAGAEMSMEVLRLIGNEQDAGHDLAFRSVL